jgi:hypothetical protein
MPAVSSEPKVTAKQAAQAAVKYLNDVCAPPTVVDNVLLEEIEFSEDERYWQVTLSFEQYPSALAMSGFLDPAVKKLRLFKIDAHSGKVVSMKIRPAP